MPSVSDKQARLMRAVAHGWHKPGGGGPSKAVAKDFVAADQGKKFDSGGSVKKAKHKGGAGITPALLASMAGPPPPPGGPPMGAGPGGPPGMAGAAGAPPGMSHGGEVHHHVHHHYASGGHVDGTSTTKPTKHFSSKMLREKKDAGGKGVAKKGETKAKKEVKMARGGTVRFAHGGHVGGNSRGDGIAQRGHTRGHMR